MQFQQIPGHFPIKQRLIQSVVEHKISHAQLFVGPEGCGSLGLALAFAQFMNCENRSETDSCGDCPSCIKSQKLIHPDIHFTFPIISKKVKVDVRNAKGKMVEDDVKKESCNDWLPEWRIFLRESIYRNYNDWIEKLDAENKQGDIPARECVEIMRKLSFKSFESTYKILILWLPEYLGGEGNRLLKILEEPPDNTIFIFVAQDTERILNTILSRMQLIKIYRFEDKIIEEELIKQFSLLPQKATQIAAMSDGNYREAIVLAQDAEDGIEENTITLRSWMAYMAKGNLKELYTWHESFSKSGRENQKKLFTYSMHFFREVILIQQNLTQLTRLNETEKSIATGLSNYLSENKILSILELIEKCIYFIERNSNPKILIAFLSTAIMRIMRTKVGKEIEAPFFSQWEV